MKKIISLLMALALLVSMTAFADGETTGSADNATDILVTAVEPLNEADIPIKIIADNKIVDTETVIVNGRTLIPLRALMESTGADVTWQGETQTVAITRNGKTISIQIGNTVMTTPAASITLDAAPILYNGDTTYAPLRAIAEEFGITVDWDGGTKTILVRTPEGTPYVDIYDGMTLKEYLEETQTPIDVFETSSNLRYDDYKDTLYSIVANTVSLESVAISSGMTLSDACALLGIDEEKAKTLTWGEAIGELTIGTYVEAILGASQYGMSQEDALESLRQSFGLGREYTLDTKVKYAKVIMDIAQIEYNKQQEELIKAQEEMLAKDMEELPELTKNKIKFTITMQDGSKMTGELYPDLAPITVENFVKLVNDKFYDGLIFHRVIDGFMIQGGGFDKNFNEKAGPEAIKGEFYANGVKNALKHEKGVISMARTNEPDSATSEFFIMDEPSPHLDGQYAAFGKITGGLDVIEKISKSETTTNDKGYTDVPVKPVIIKSIRIDK